MNLIFVASLFWYVTAPVADMRMEPHPHGEIESQSYFSEQVSILEDGGDWVKIKTDIDGDMGWVKKTSLMARDSSYLEDVASIATVNRCAAHLYPTDDIIYGPILTLPYESKLAVINQQTRWIKVALPDGKEAFIQRGDVTFNRPNLSMNEMIELCYQFLDLPYTWGGRTSFGYDCSGFVQMLYRQMGVNIPRNSAPQYNWEGWDSITLDQLAPGDLIFWGLSEDKIKHVGMYIGDHRFIHASARENQPFLRINNLSDQAWSGSDTYVFIAAKTLKKEFKK